MGAAAKQTLFFINKTNHLDLTVLFSLTKNQNMMLVCLNIINKSTWGGDKSNITDICNSFMTSKT